MAARLKTFLFFVLIAALLAAVEIVPAGFLDGDGYYHAQMARLLARGVFLTDFPWLTATTWAKSFADQHLLYHLLLIPFVKIHPIVGAQIFNVLAGMAFCFIFYDLLRSGQIRHAKLWVLALLFLAPGFLFRLALVKAVPLSLVLLMLCWRALLGNRPKTLGLLSLVFVWTYGGFVFVPVLLALYLTVMTAWPRLECRLSAAATGRPERWRQPIIYSLAGLLLALLLFPHADKLIVQLYNQIFQAGLGYKIPVGGEWSPLDWMTLFSNYGFLFAAWLIACLLGLWRPKTPAGWPAWLLFLVSVFFFGLSLKSQRFIEYAAPFMVLYCAQTFDPWLKRYSRQHLKSQTGQLLKYFPVLAGGLGVMLTCLLATLLTARQFHHPRPLADFQGASNFLLAHSQARQIVFNTEWAYFPDLWFLDDQNYYVAGMDQMFMYLADRGKYWLWRHISYGDAAICAAENCALAKRANLAEVLRSDFNASYILVEQTGPDRLNRSLAGDNADFGLAYQDSQVVIYRVLGR